MDAAQFNQSVIEQGATMRQLQVEPLASAEGPKEGQGSVEHGIAGGLGGQCHVQAAMTKPRLQPQVGQQGQFGLAFAHRRFDDQQHRRCCSLQQAICGALQWSGSQPGDVGYTQPAEIVPGLQHVRGSVAAARTGDQVNPERRSSGSQFYICFVPTPFLDSSYTVFGEVVSGMDNVDKLTKGAPGSGSQWADGR